MERASTEQLQAQVDALHQMHRQKKAERRTAKQQLGALVVQAIAPARNHVLAMHSFATDMPPLVGAVSHLPAYMLSAMLNVLVPADATDTPPVDSEAAVAITMTVTELVRVHEESSRLLAALNSASGCSDDAAQWFHVPLPELLAKLHRGGHVVLAAREEIQRRVLKDCFLAATRIVKEHRAAYKDDDSEARQHLQDEVTAWGNTMLYLGLVPSNPNTKDEGGQARQAKGKGKERACEV